jgi:hypothetical protein
VPAATAAYAVHAFPHPEQLHWVFITTILGAIFAYIGAVALGAPAFLILRARNHTALWIAIILGFGIGGAMWFIFAVLFGFSLGNSFDFVWREAVKLSNWWAMLIPGTLGPIVGTTLWLIARPDRARVISD